MRFMRINDTSSFLRVTKRTQSYMSFRFSVSTISFPQML